MGVNHWGQLDRNPLYFCPICYRKLHKCLNFEHVERSKHMMEICEKFGGEFTEFNEYEPNSNSYYEFYKMRYEYLNKSIKPEDYEVDCEGNAVARSKSPHRSNSPIAKDHGDKPSPERKRESTAIDLRNHAARPRSAGSRSPTRLRENSVGSVSHRSGLSGGWSHK